MKHLPFPSLKNCRDYLFFPHRPSLPVFRKVKKVDGQGSPLNGVTSQDDLAPFLKGELSAREAEAAPPSPLPSQLSFRLSPTLLSVQSEESSHPDSDHVSSFNPRGELVRKSHTRAWNGRLSSIVAFSPVSRRPCAF